MRNRPKLRHNSDAMLKIVPRDEGHRPIHLQASLFPHSDPNLLLLVTLPLRSGTEFMNLVEISAPRLIIDLRGVPRFDFDTLNRRKVFEVFSKNNCTYIDAKTPMAPWSEEGQWLETFSKQKPLAGMKAGQLSGPFMFLFNQYEDMTAFEHFLRKELSTIPSVSWSFFLVAEQQEFAVKRFAKQI
jgi:hypothetical protein